MRGVSCSRRRTGVCICDVADQELTPGAKDLRYFGGCPSKVYPWWRVVSLYNITFTLPVYM